MARLLLAFMLSWALLGLAAPAAAGSSVSFGISVGSYGHHGHGYHRHKRYYGHQRHYGHDHRRHYYHRPPAVIFVPPPPPPVYYRPAPRVVLAPVCREYRGDATVDGRGTRFYGRACLLDDGRWHIVRVD